MIVLLEMEVPHFCGRGRGSYSFLVLFSDCATSSGTAIKQWDVVHQEAGPSAARRYMVESVLFGTKQQAAISSDQLWSGFVLSWQPVK